MNHHVTTPYRIIVCRISAGCTLALLVLLGTQTSAFADNDTEQERHQNLYELSRSYMASEPDKALEYATSALEIAERTNDHLLLGKSLYLKGLVLYFKGKYPESTEYYHNALTYLEGLTGDEVIQLKENTWNNLGVNEDLSGRNFHSAKAYRNSLRYARKRDNPRGVAQTRINLALADIRVGLFHEARKNLEKAMTFFESRDDYHHMGLTAQNTGVLYEYKNIPEKAVPHFETSIAYFEKSESEWYLRSAKLDLLRVLLIMEKRRDAADIIAGLTEDHTPEANNYMDLNLLISMGVYEKDYGDLQKARNYITQVLEGSRNFNVPLNTERLYIYLAEINAKLGDMDAFSENMDAYREIRADTTTQYYNVRFLEFRSEMERELAEARVAAQAESRLLMRAWPWLLPAGIFLVSVGAYYIYAKRQRSSDHPPSRFAAQDTLPSVNRRVDRSDALVLRVSPPATPSPFFDSRSNSAAPEAPAQENNTSSTTPVTGAGHAEYADVSPDEWGIITTEEKLEKLCDEIMALIEKEELFRNQGISLSDIAYRLASNRKYVSMAINSKTGKSFNTFINEYRIARAKKLLKQEGTHASSKWVARETGFGSISSYHRVFKEFTGTTPADWLKKEAAIRKRT